MILIKRALFLILLLTVSVFTTCGDDTTGDNSLIMNNENNNNINAELNNYNNTDNTDNTDNTAMTDLEAVSEDEAALVIGYSGSDSAGSVLQDVTLDRSGINGTTITWSSDTPGVIANDGTVIRPNYGSSDVEVTLTARISKGEESDTKIFSLTVLEIMTGSKFTYSTGSMIFSTVYVPGGLTFPRETDDSLSGTITDAYEIAEIEATNELVREILQWAYDQGKFDEIGAGVDSTTAVYGTQQLLDLDGGDIQISFDSNTFSVDSGFEKYPVVEITWYGSVILCNWMTEMLDGNTDNLVYYGIDSSWLHGETSENVSKTGFRLLSSYEWEAAARYIGTINPGYGLQKPLGSGIYWTPGTYASGSPDDYNNAFATGEVAWYVDNSIALPNSDFVSGKGTHPVGTAENPPGDGLPLTGNANQLGVFDMSGNVSEWCFTEFGTSSRRIRGGHWLNSSSDLQVGEDDSHYPNYKERYLGFRFAKTR